MSLPSVTVKTTVSPNVALTSVQIIGSNASRKGFILYNNSANSCYINFAATASSNSCSIIVPTFASWSWTMTGGTYTGQISAIRNAGSGTIIVTEFNYAYNT